MSSRTDAPDIPERSWSNPFPVDTPIHDLFDEVVRQERDIIILVDDMHARRGTGKTVASMQIANGMDQTEEGLTADKCSLDPEEIREAYSEQPKRSGLVLDEGEVGASNRQAMSKVNQALREIMSMGRVEEKYVVVNTPAREFIDKDIQKLSDVWISMARKGRGIVHFLERQPYDGTLLTPKKGYLEFNDIPSGHELRDVYNELTAEKQRRIRGDDGSGFIRRDEHEEELEAAREEAAKAARDELIAAFYTHPEVRDAGISQRVVAEAAGVAQKTVSNVVQRETNSG